LTLPAKKLYIETYGCQMNFADTEVVYGIMNKFGYSPSNNINESNVVLLNTCSIREHAESKIYQRLSELKKFKVSDPGIVIGIIGCMAGRLKNDLLKKSGIVDLIVGPDEYRKLPQLIENLAYDGEKGIAVKLSRVETYDDITPLRKDGITAWLSIMRGCDKFCSFCVVPYTRGRERSRSLQGVVREVEILWQEGFKEVTLLGQNVNSYRSRNVNFYRSRRSLACEDSNREYDFADLLKACALAVPDMRIRFTTSHPMDLSVKLLETIAAYDNICNYIHLPVQSGSNRILSLMKRNYTVEHYLKLVENARKIIPDVSMSTDIISGFPTETEYDHNMTMEIIKEIRYDGAYMFKYSPREHTKAFQMNDDVNDEIKTNRLQDIISVQRDISSSINSAMIGKTYRVLIESESKKSASMLMGRTDGNKSVIIPKNGTQIGDLVDVIITNANSATLFGDIRH
jgi:tRNA-2-methylthio-N6-dimethylallyladenosine synthase